MYIHLIFSFSIFCFLLFSFVIDNMVCNKKDRKWCTTCRALVPNRSRHWYRHHQSKPWCSPSATPTPRGSTSTPQALKHLDMKCLSATLTTPQKTERATDPSTMDTPTLTSYIPPSPWYYPTSPDAEEWVLEPQCTIQLPDDVPLAEVSVPTSSGPDAENISLYCDVAAQADGVEWEHTHPRKHSLRHFPLLHIVTPGTSSNGRHDIATQADGSIDARSHVTRALFEKVGHVHVVQPSDMPNISDYYFTRERCFAERVADSRRRRLCDCYTCVSHAVSLTRLAYPCELSPPQEWLSCMYVPGLQLHPSTEDDRKSLIQFLLENPEQSYVVCGCIPCTLHRNCVKAWSQAREYRDATPTQREVVALRHKSARWHAT